MIEESVSPTPNKSEIPRAVWLLSGVSFFADVSSEMVYPLLPLFLVVALESSKTQLGIIEGSAVLLVALMTAWAGFRSDRMGKRVPWIRWGYGLPVLGKGIIALATAWPLVLGGRLLDRFGKGLRGAPRDALIADVVTAELRGRAFGLHRTFDTAGALVGVLLAAFLLWWLTGTPAGPKIDGASAIAVQSPAWVYRAVFGVGALLGLLSLGLAFCVRETESPKPSNTTESNSRGTPPEKLVAPSSAAQLDSRWLSLPKSYWLVLSVLALFSLANSSDTFILLRASELGFSPWVVVLIYAVYNVTYSALSYPAGALSDRLGRWRIIGFGWGIYAAVYAGIAFLPATSAWGIWPLMAFYGVYMALTDGVGKALITDHAPHERRGAAIGLFYAITGVTTLAASLLAGLAWDYFGSSTVFLLGTAFATLALGAVFVIRRMTVVALTN